MLWVGANTIPPRRYRSRTEKWNEVHEEKSGKKVKSIIVKLKWRRQRKQFYDARSKNSKKSKKEPDYKSFSVSVDLTRRRYMLLRKARELIKNNDDTDFTFADINCSLRFRYKNCSFRYFHDLLSTRPRMSHLKAKIKRPVFQTNSTK